MASTSSTEDRLELTSGVLHASRIVKELSNVRHMEALCDGTIRLLDGTVRVSKALLAAGCPYFRALYQFEDGCQGGGKKTSEPRLDITSSTFELILDYTYTGRVLLHSDNIEDVLKASDLLLMTDLKELCIQYLMGRIDVDNCLGILQFAQQFSCPRLVHFAKDIICQHFKHRQIVRTEEFRTLSEDRLSELLSWDGVEVRSEVDILGALVYWLNCNMDTNPNVESLVTSCLRESSDLSYDPKFQRALQAVRATQSPWDSPGATRVRDALARTRRIRCIRKRGTKTVLACCDSQARVYLVDIFSQGKHAGSHVCLPPLCRPRIKPSMVVEGGYLFVLGGMSVEDRKPRSDVQRYDPTTNTWTLQASMPYAACSPKVVALAGKLYVTGGYDDEVELEIGQLEEYDVYSNQWRPLPCVPNRRRGAAVAASGDKIYYIGGSPWQEPQMGSLFFRVLDAVDIFFIKEEVWVSGPQLQERRCYAAAVSQDSNIFVVGGVRPIECPSAHGQLKITGTEGLYQDSHMGWTKLSQYHVPSEASVCLAALAHPRHLVVLGNARPSEVTRTSCYITDGSGWSSPPGADSILTSGTHVFHAYALITLPSAAIQDLTSQNTD
ncbi:hypothetical protein Pmani_024095 [Petrolisthes manimaculis]|uniref:Kelch-like protein diablo n=1 Tax=Petrolisthes manimaculis TaxID=1843537 RepID=A0AAE1U0D4_9EUCA|nr:hypothetical protein Pmani_024095 [Petrolisthes manimaculis]